MAGAFIPITDFGKIEPCITPAEAAERIAATVGAPKFRTKHLNGIIQVFYNGRIPWQDGAWDDVQRLAANTVLDWLISGSIRSYVEAADSGKHFRIPEGYWSMQSGTDNLWHILSVFDRCDWARGFDESMVGQPILISESDAPKVTIRTVPPEQTCAGTEADSDDDKHPVSSAKAIRECVQWLKEELAKEETAGTTRDEFKRIAVEERYRSRLYGRGFLTAWKEATQLFPDRKKSGPKPSK